MLFDRVRRRKMNTGEHGFSGEGKTVQSGRDRGGVNPALTELRRKLNDGLARSRMDKKDLPGRSGLGRTTVWEALQDGEPVPSERTVGALARAETACRGVAGVVA